MTEKVNSRISIQSQPNGINKFYELLINSERKDNDPKELTGGKLMDETRNGKRILYLIGGLDAFNQEYDLQKKEIYDIMIVIVV
jgi:hypothetical protein